MDQSTPSAVNRLPVSRLVAHCFIAYFTLSVLKGIWLPTLMENRLLFLAFDITAFCVIPVFLLSMLWRRFDVRPHVYVRKTAAADWPWMLGVATFAAVAGHCLYRVGSAIGQWTGDRIPDLMPLQISYQSVEFFGWAHWVYVVYLAVTAGVVEELFYRGMVRRVAEELLPARWSKLGFVIGSSLIFALIHWHTGLPNMAGCFTFGLLFAGIYLEFDDLRPLIVAHIGLDFWYFS
ncbi:CPBP family intramembrane glutamic endopeptidase [Parachitinimonas caeni]|uniref:CPBP family intramembrane metalloprotease n=1 Tax=Parachitinimonas caeni TaxID=3031301 RepID=A0ABT7DUD8_9NEIS|nr:CPBP family intramembrane glutamic endopeptidase [Parachitinimonas caeni]MDK2123429.1 CPBP family intramembrane metalloprotease [Parachitinimonas caeni]